MPTIADVISRYDSICTCCALWNKAVSCNPDQIRCHIGCSECCELETVSAIEAFKVIMHIGFNTQNYSSINLGYCSFLENSRCRIYNCRPLICRTHGFLSKVLKTHVFKADPTILKGVKTQTRPVFLIGNL